jgi:hypothetical protein
MSNERAPERAPPGDGVSDTLERSQRYDIHRAPDLMTITPGAQVQYRCQPRHGSLRAAGTPGDGIRWYKFAARALLEETRHEDPNWAVPIEKGPIGEYLWDCQWSQAPGRYVIGSEILRGGDSTFCFLPQYVETAGLVVGGSLEKLLKGGPGPAPAEAVGAVERQIETLDTIAKRFPIARPDDQRRHREAVDRWRDCAARLRGLLASSEGKTRIAIPAMHLETATQARRPLLLFLCHVGDDVVGHSARKRPRWILVDWTEATDPRFHGTYEGVGDTPDEAIKSALSDWDWGNRYPEGLVTYELPAHAFGQAHRREMPTNGKSLGDEIKSVLEWIAIGGMVVGGALALFAAVPALASGMLGSSLLSSTGAATISISQRWRAGIFDWREDAFDGLTIIGNVFAASGTWTRGARVLMRDKSGEAVERIFIGARLASDVVQGVLLADQALEEWTALSEDPDILPEERIRRMLALIRGLVISGTLTYLSLRASTRELDTFNKKPDHVESKGPTLPTGEKVSALTDSKATVDATKPPPVEGHTDKQIAKAEVKEAAAHPRKPLASEETAFATKYPQDPALWKNRLVLKEQLHLEDLEGFVFDAKCEDGTLTCAIFTKDKSRPGVRPKNLWAKELFPRMYEHFKDVGNPVLRLKGEWVYDNFTSVEAKYQELIAQNWTPKAALDEAVLHARTYVDYHKERGFTKVLSSYRGKDYYMFEIVDPSRE